MTSFEQLVKLAEQRKIKIIPIFSMPRVGGTTLGRALINGKVNDNSVLVFFNEPGNLGIADYCLHSSASNFRDQEEINELILIACRLEILKLRLAGVKNELYPKITSYKHRVNELVAKLNAHRTSIKELVDEHGSVIPERVEQYNENIYQVTMQLDAEVSQFLITDKLPIDEGLPPISLILKDHVYNFNAPEFSERLKLIRKTNSNIIFMVRDPWENCASILYRRVVHFLAEGGNITNQEIKDFVETFFYSEKEFTQDDIVIHFEKSFKSGDQLSRQRLLEFIGKKEEALDQTYQITVADMRKLADEMIAHCKKMFEVSWDNFAEYYHRVKAHDPSHLIIVDFNKLVEDPEKYLAILTEELSGFTVIPSAGWSEQSKEFYSGAAMYLGPRDLRIWFRSVLSANGITKQEGGLIGAKPQLPKRLADSVVERASIYREALKDEVTASKHSREAAMVELKRRRDLLGQISTFDSKEHSGVNLISEPSADTETPAK